MSRSNQLAGLLTADPPSALDTINEINTALGNDAALSTTLTNSIATKMPLAGGLFTGNVGIGASSLTGGNVGLDIHKTGSGVGSQIRLKNQHNAGFYIGQAGDTTGEVIIWNDANTDMQFRTNGDERLRITSDGNVGIGGNPSAKLDVNGTALIGPNSEFELTSAGSEIRLHGANTLTMRFLRKVSNIATNLGVLTFGADYGSISNIDSASINAIAPSAWSGSGDTPSDLAFYTTPDGSNSKNERLRITNDGTVQITDANAGSQQSTQDFKIGRATIQVANVDTTSNTSYGAGFTFKTYDYNGSSFVNHDALRITAKGDVVVGHDNYIHGTAHDPNEGSHGTALFKTNGDFVQTGGDYDPRSGTSETLFTPYHRRSMITNIGRNVGQSHDAWYMWYKIDGVDGIYANASTPYIELRVIGHSGHHSGSLTRVIMINPCSNDTGHGSLVASQMGKNEASRGYGQTLEVFLYGNTNGANDVYMMIKQAQREPHVSIIADLYATTRNMHSINNFGITFYGGGTGSSTTQPSNVGTHRASFTN